jgi:hypothetical protein
VPVGSDDKEVIEEPEKEIPPIKKEIRLRRRAIGEKA